jgi:hypothetical protein
LHHGSAHYGKFKPVLGQLLEMAPKEPMVAKAILKRQYNYYASQKKHTQRTSFNI